MGVTVASRRGKLPDMRFTGHYTSMRLHVTHEAIRLEMTGDHSTSDIQRCKILLRLDVDILQVTSSVGPSRRCIWIPGYDQRDRQPIISVRTRMGFDRSMYRVANADCTRKCIHLRSLYNPQL
ncbi:hypothetical protein CY34DRAFT_811826 [Suillus luteus UH-Slu-Lm8-n1]|uniref:Uncharacterized protein n=1 Tax=Suillus luteus UH-Slu-Lm8-n1 TaxID=930992 RepID=A0A0D0AVE7_9AGAM|nr:hypothetical protein CY34DRAFT_811826 [Suillus luteus UH-Slu-Lm8-n1]